MNKYNLQKLTPIKCSELKVYDETLDFVFQEDDLKNVAITGPYSSGKSSVLETYKESHPGIKFIHISLAHFQSIEDEKDDDFKYNEATIEGKILNQLIHQINPSKIPQTHFKIKNDIPIWKTIINTLLTVLFVILLSYMLNFNSWLTLVLDLPGSWLKSLLNLTVHGEYLILAGTVCVLIFAYFMFCIIKVQSERSILRKVSFQGNEIEILENNNESYFDKYLNEVLYIFNHSNADVIVFEDIDRYSDNQIFEKLREINFLTNKKGGKTIRFFYLLRDDIFENKDRTKFFDFIMPIVPIVDSSNSYDQFIEHFKSGGILEKFDENFLQGISLYIDDMRILKNIYNEFMIYHERIQSTELNNNKLLATITYKNIFPKDFSELQLARGYVYSIFSNKDKYMQNQVRKNNQTLNELKDKITIINNELLSDIDDLDAVFLTFGNKVLMINNKLDNQYESRALFISAMKENPTHVMNVLPNGSTTPFDFKSYLNELIKNPEYSKRKALIEQKDENKIDILKQEIVLIQNNNSLIESQKLSTLIVKENLNEIFENDKNNTTGNSEHEDVKASPYFLLIIYLIRNGYIDETYQDYLTYFYENSLSATDKIFLRSITDEVAKEFSYEINKPEKIIARLRVADFDKEEILNFSLLDYLLGYENIFIDRLFAQLRDKKRIEFIWGYLGLNSKKEAFVNKLNHLWPQIWDYLINNKILDEDQEKNYMIDTLYFTDADDITIMNENDCMKIYISSNPNFLDIVNPDQSKLLIGLKLLDIKFINIDYDKIESNLFEAVYKNSLYEINFNMVSIILIEIYKEPSSEDFKHKNYSLIMMKPDESLALYIKDNMDEYMDMLLENCEEIVSDTEENALALLNNKIISEEKRLKYIEYYDGVISTIDSVEDVSIWQLLIQNWILKCSSHNILQYFFKYGNEIDEFLVDFINESYEELDFVLDEIIKEYGESEALNFFEGIMQSDDLHDEKYEMILSKFTYRKDFLFIEIPNSKLKILIDLKILIMTRENLLFMRLNYANEIMYYISSNIKDYEDILIIGDNYILDEVIKLLELNCISDEDKLKLLTRSSEPITLSEKEYTEEVVLHILENNFNINDLVHLISIYSKQTKKIKSAIYLKAESNIETIIAGSYTLPHEIMICLLSSKITDANKKKIFIQNLAILDDHQAKEALKVLDLTDYLSLFEGKRPKIFANEESEAILTIFKRNDWITQFERDKNEPEYFRVIGHRFGVFRNNIRLELL